jgi:hypothetical protein
VTGLGATAGYFTCDRWKTNFNGTAGRLTQTQTADGPNGISANCLKLDCTTADTSIAAAEYLFISQYFEGQNLQRIGKGVTGAKQTTLSFYVKANAAFTFGAELVDADNSRSITKLFATTTGWVRHELTFPADVDDGSSPYDDDNAASLELNFWLHAGSNFTSGTLNTAAFANRVNTTRAAGIDSFFSSTDNNFFITGVQMEVGPVATPFEHRSYGEELALCQRYTWVQKRGATGSSDNAYLGIGRADSTSTAEVIIRNPVVMRDAPEVTLSGNIVANNGAGRTGTGYSVQEPGTDTFQITGTGMSSLTANQAVRIYLQNETNTITVDAEL